MRLGALAGSQAGGRHQQQNCFAILAVCEGTLAIGDCITRLIGMECNCGKRPPHR